MIPLNSSANRNLQVLARNTLNDCWRPQPKSGRDFARAAGAAAAAYAPCLVRDSDCVGCAAARGDDRFRRFVQPDGRTIRRSRPRDGRDASLGSTYEQCGAAAAKTPTALLADHHFV